MVSRSTGDGDRYGLVMSRLRRLWRRYLHWRNDVEIPATDEPDLALRKADVSDRDLNKQQLGLSQPPQF